MVGMEHFEGPREALEPLEVLDLLDIEAAEAPMNRDLMPIKTAAALLNISEQTIRRLLDAGEIPGLKVSRSYRVYGPFVEAALALIRAGHRVVLEELAAQWPLKATALEGAA